MTMTTRTSLVSLSLLLLIFAQGVLGYASWLKCFIDLDDSEVIMNYNVVSYEDATHKVKLQFKLDNDDDTADWTSQSITYSPKEETKLRIKLNVPEAMSQLDVQYVIETTQGATFTTRRMCDGTRSHAPSHDTETLLTIDASQPSVQLWAGWAMGHEPVYLTEKLTLYRQGDADSGEL